MTTTSADPARRPGRRRLSPGITRRAAVIDLDTFPPGRIVPLPGRRRDAWVRMIEGPPGAPTVVLLHGLFATADINWATSYEALRTSYTVIAIDQEGHGRGARTRRPFRLERCADDVAAVCEALGVTAPIVCGYSMGGPIALLTWRRHPELVRGLVLCATVSRFNGHRPAERAGLLALAAGARLAGLVPRSLRASALRGFTGRVERDEQNQWLLDQAVNSDLAAGVQAVAAILGFDARPWISEVDVPTAVVVTARDTLLSPRRQHALARAIPGAVTVECAADHATIIERDTPFPAALVTALDTITAPA